MTPATTASTVLRARHHLARGRTARLLTAAGCALAGLLLSACGSGAAPATTRPAAAGASAGATGGGAGLVSIATTPAAPSGAWPYYGVRIEPSIATPTFELTDTTGARYQPSARTTGRIVTLFFGYTACPDECPTTMADIAVALKQLPAATRNQITTLFVTLDPAHDTPKVLRGWLDQFNSSFVGLSGAVSVVDHDAKSLGVPAEPPTKDASGTDTVEHGTETLVFGRDGVARFVWSPETSPEQMLHDLKLLAA